MPHRLMNPFLEKIGFGLSSLAFTGFSTLGAIMTTGETRWVYVTFASSSLMSGFLSLMFRRSDETIHLAIGRFGFALMGGILGTKPIIHQLGFSQLCETDIISLAGLSSMTCIATFTVGVAALKMLEKLAPEIVAKYFKKYVPQDQNYHETTVTVNTVDRPVNAPPGKP